MSKSFQPKGIDFSLNGVGIEEIDSRFLKAAWFMVNSTRQIEM
jgi:hypothetical protein